MTEDVREPGAEIAIVTGDGGVGKFAVEIGDERVGVAELDGADTFIGSREKHLAEITFADGVTDGESFAAIAVGERSHPQPR